MSQATKLIVINVAAFVAISLQLTVIFASTADKSYWSAFPIIDIVGVSLNALIYSAHTALGSPHFVWKGAVRQDIYLRLAIVTFITLLSPIVNATSCVYHMTNIAATDKSPFSELYAEHSLWFVYSFVWVCLLGLATIAVPIIIIVCECYEKKIKDNMTTTETYEVLNE